MAETCCSGSWMNSDLLTLKLRSPVRLTDAPASDPRSGGEIKFKRAQFFFASPSIQQLSARRIIGSCRPPQVSSANPVTHVPRTSLKSNIVLMSSTCFFHDPSPDSPFSFAISHWGWRYRGWRERRDAETLPEDQLSPPDKKKKKEKERKVHSRLPPQAPRVCVSAPRQPHAGSQKVRPTPRG